MPLIVSGQMCLLLKSFCWLLFIHLFIFYVLHMNFGSFMWLLECKYWLLTLFILPVDSCSFWKWCLFSGKISMDPDRLLEPGIGGSSGWGSPPLFPLMPHMSADRIERWHRIGPILPALKLVFILNSLAAIEFWGNLTIISSHGSKYIKVLR